jgi:hypothetical protein
MKIYQWPPAKGTESIFPRCVIFQRICNIAGPPVAIANMRLPEAGENFVDELQTHLRGLPILEVNGERLRTSAQILNFLIENGGSQEIKAKLSKMSSVYSRITQQWANESFINSLIWVRWKDEENFQKFYPTVSWGEDLAAVEPRIVLLRAEILKFLKRSPIGGLSDEQFSDLFKSQLWSLENILQAQEYFEPFINHPTLTDLYVFMNIQGLLCTDFPQSDWMRKNCPSLMKWYHLVDERTSKIPLMTR